VRADGTGLSSRAGTALLALTADRVGLTDGFVDALAHTRLRRAGHEPGRVACDLAVMLADGGRCVSDLAALGGQPALFGEVASVSTARRVVLAIGEQELAAIRAARARARGRAWKLGAAPERVILDFDATPIDVHSEKEDAAGHYKGGFGFNPLLVSCGREVLAGILRPGNAGANNADDHLELLDLALEQLPRSALDGDILARSDSAGASHDLADACRETGIRFSFGYPLTEPVRQALLALEEAAWRPAVDGDGQPRDGAWVAELTGKVGLDTWPSGTRLICRRERPHPGAQLSFTDVDGHRFQCFLTDQTDVDIAALEVLHRQHAQVEDRIKTLKATGASFLPFCALQANAAWFELALCAHDVMIWTQLLALDGEHRVCEPKRLRYRILHVAGQLTRHARRHTLHLPADWPWASAILRAFKRLEALPAPT
jgi:Transposase DDE domain group 1